MKQFVKLIPVLHWAGLKSASVKVAVPSKVQQQLHLEKMFALLYQGKEMKLHSIFIMTRKPLGDSNQTVEHCKHFSSASQQNQHQQPLPVNFRHPQMSPKTSRVSLRIFLCL